MTLIYLGLSWIAGIVTGSFLPLPLWFSLTGLIPVSFIVFSRQYRRVLVLAGFCVMAFFTGTWYYSNSLPEDDTANLMYYNDSGPVEIKGIVNRDPEQTSKTVRLHINSEAIFRDGTWHPVKGTALVYVPLYSDYRYGDILLIKGVPETPPQLDDFDYEHYLAVKGIYSTFYQPEIEVLETGQGNILFEWIYSFRNSLADSINKVLPEPQASLTNGMLLGIRSAIPESTRQDFNGTGLSHLLAISGLHLSIIAGIFVTAGRRMFGRRGYVYVWLALTAIWLYAILSGLNPPVIRASIMVSLYLAAEFFGRQRSAGTALVLAAAVMTVFSPSILLDASFQMSFAAMAGLIIVLPVIQNLNNRFIYRRLNETSRVTPFITVTLETLSVSLAAVLAVWPLTAYYFGTIAPLSPLATFFTLPALPLIIGGGFLTGITGLVFLPAAQVIAWMTWIFTSWIVLVVKAFSFIPSIEGFQPNVFIIIGYYLLIVAGIFVISKKYKDSDITPEQYGTFSFSTGTKVIAVLLTIAVLVSITAVTQPDDRLHVSFLDVGQGDAILIQQGHSQILIDGGPDPTAVIRGLSEQLPLWDRTIDMVILTHPDADHVTGLIEVLERYSVENVMYADLESNSTPYTEFINLIDELNLITISPEAGQQITFGDGITITILNPTDGIESKDPDNDSIVCELTAGDINFLFTGDIMEETEVRLVSNRLVADYTVLKAAHHGSGAASSEIFLSVTMPEFTVISAGAGNMYGHPSYDMLQRLDESTNSSIYRTDLNGTIEFITDGYEVWIKTEK